MVRRNQLKFGATYQQATVAKYAEVWHGEKDAWTNERRDILPLGLHISS